MSDEIAYPRLRQFTWSWFTFPMNTGSIALLLSKSPHRFQGLDTIGLVFFLFDSALFCSVCAVMIVRFVLCKGTFVRSLQHPNESLFLPTFFLAIGIILMGVATYAHLGKWISIALKVLFWIYYTTVFCLAVISMSCYSLGRRIPFKV